MRNNRLRAGSLTVNTAGEFHAPLLYHCAHADISCRIAAYAVVLPDDVQQKLDQEYDAFAQSEGFKPVDPMVVNEGFYSRQRFPNPDTTSVYWVDADLDAATKALMLLDSREPALPRARYRIAYRLNDTPYATGYTAIYVEVTRFNVGPRLYAETVASTLKGVPVRKADFGVGPSVSWRFVMRRRQGALDIQRTARRVLTEVQAQAMDCLGVSCLATTDPTGPAGDWQKTRPPPIKSASYVAFAHGRSTASRIAALLYRKASHGEKSIEPLHAYSDTPQLTLVISMNIGGNEFVADGLLHQSLLQDDAISDIWIHRPDWGGDPVEWQQLIKYRSNRH